MELKDILAAFPEIGRGRDLQVVRCAMNAELEAIQLYEELLAISSDDYPEMTKVLLDVIKEEKTHVGEFQAILNQLDVEQAQELQEGAQEALG